MSRFVKGAVIVSQPIRTFPNGDFLVIEMQRAGSRYTCSMHMRRPAAASVEMVRVQAATVREAQERCYERAVEKCPRLPRPPYLKRGGDTVRTPV